MSKRTKWDEEYEKNSKLVEDLGEEFGVGAAFVLIIFLAAISFGIAQVVIYAICTIAGTPYSLWTGFSIWMLYLVIKYVIKINTHVDD